MGKAKKNRKIKNTIITQRKVRSKLDIGNPDALYDKNYLESCFVETEISDDLMDARSVRSVLVGRTGAGKTACIQRIVQLSEIKNFRYAEIHVEGEFLGYLKNLQWLKQIAEDRKCNLIPLFKNLWRHIIVINLIKKEFSSQKNFLEKITQFFSKKQKCVAQLRNYVEVYGGDFWETSHVSEKAARSVIWNIEGKLKVAGFSAKGGRKQSDTVETSDARVDGRHGDVQEAITDRQWMNELQHTIQYINEYVRKDVPGAYYVLVDKLDEEWIDDSIRYSLIRALIEVIRDFYADKDADGHSIKVVVALRRDLLDKVRETRSPGYQSEKYSPFESEMKWSEIELKTLIEKRIDHMYKNEYTKQPVNFSDIFPSRCGKQGTMDYMIERTLLRPRDMIAFVNSCLEKYDGKQLTRAAIRSAEQMYSNGRYDSIMDEWKLPYPNLNVYAEILTHKEFQQSGSMDFSTWRTKAEELVVGAVAGSDPYLIKWIEFLDKSKIYDMAVELLNILYCVGLVQIKPSATSQFQAYPASISPGQYKKELRIKIHPMFYGKFGVNPQK